KAVSTSSASSLDRLNHEYMFNLFTDPEHISLIVSIVSIAYNVTQFPANGNIVHDNGRHPYPIILGVSILYLLNYLIEGIARKITVTEPDQSVAYVARTAMHESESAIYRHCHLL
ncbi:hypothetical protein N7524_011430, partial [Penicillium chrysogenum]